MWQLSPLNPVGESLSHKLTHVPLKDTALEDEEIETQIQLEQTVRVQSRPLAVQSPTQKLNSFIVMDLWIALERKSSYP